MRAGSLRHIVTVQKNVKTPDGMGSYIETWEDLATVRAAIWPKKMFEREESGQKVATTIHQIRIRYIPGVDEECRVMFGVREFEIISFLNWEERDRYLDLTCEEKR